MPRDRQRHRRRRCRRGTVLGLGSRGGGGLRAHRDPAHRSVLSSDGLVVDGDRHYRACRVAPGATDCRRHRLRGRRGLQALAVGVPPAPPHPLSRARTRGTNCDGDGRRTRRPRGLAVGGGTVRAVSSADVSRRAGVGNREHGGRGLDAHRPQHHAGRSRGVAHRHDQRSDLGPAFRSRGYPDAVDDLARRANGSSRRRLGRRPERAARAVRPVIAASTRSGSRRRAEWRGSRATNASRSSRGSRCF